MKRSGQIATLLKAFFVIQAVLHPYCANSLLLDIHLPLKKLSPQLACVHDEALRWNQALRLNEENKNPNNAENSEYIDFNSHHTPHITLYLADFDVENNEGHTTYFNETLTSINETKFDTLIDSIRNSVKEIQYKVKSDLVHLEYPCDMQITEPLVNAAYTMLDIQNNKCLQFLSDTIVNNTRQFVRFPSPIPDWIYTIKDPKKQKAKIDLIRKYGSPNVFKGFEPHVTVAYEMNMSIENLQQRQLKVQQLQKNLPSNCIQIGDFMALGFTSIGGTVVQGPIVDIDIRLNDIEESGSVDISKN